MQDPPTGEEFGKLLERSYNPNRKFDRIHRTPLVSIGEVFYTADNRVGPRIQDRFELVIIRQGRATFHIDEGSVDLVGGEMLLLKPGHREQWDIHTEFSEHHHIWCIIRKELAPSSLLSKLAEFPIGTKLQAAPEFLALIDIALNVKTPRGSTTDVLFYEYLALTIFFEFARVAEKNQGEGKVFPVALIKAIEFIEKNLQRGIHLTEIALAAGVAKHYLIKLFRTHMNDTPMHFLWNLRAQQGAELLRSSGLNVSEVAAATGFQSPFHFSRFFKKIHGVSPKKFREKMWSKAQLKITAGMASNPSPSHASKKPSKTKAGHGDFRCSAPPSDPCNFSHSQRIVP